MEERGTQPLWTTLPRRYYARMTMDFQTNKRICEEVAIIPSKALKNKIAGYATVSCGPTRYCDAAGQGRRGGGGGS